ncbi:MAG: hypothetical protein HC884_05950 [Chloroflexaceae bacterium]|nr:hypothetical protein [Chloroflexaceae bacterium]
MHRFLAGICQMLLRLTAQQPWMVRGEIEGNHTHVLTDRFDRPILPASSLKGVLRSTAERILRSMHPERDPTLCPLADEPFVHREGKRKNAYATWLQAQSRSHIADSELVEWNNHRKHYPDDALDSTQVYRLLSPASQLFGCTLHRGLVTLEDAHATESTTWRRSHVAIDRLTGGVGQGPFTDDQVPEQTVLESTLTIHNFALWQIGLLALVFQEISLGYVPVGGGTRKGQGQMQVEVPSITFQYSDAAYHHSGRTGIISAQARLAHPPWSVRDAPSAVTAVEQNLVLLEDIEPQLTQEWHQQGITTLQVQETQVPRLFQAAVRDAWRPWIQRMKEGTP